MKLSGDERLPVAPPRAWAALNDPAVLKQAIPGCEAVTPLGDDRFELALAVAIGPVKARFTGELRLVDVDAPHGATLQVEARSPAGHGKGTAQVRLSADDDDPGATRLHYDATGQVGGKLAQVGSRLVDMAAAQLATQFFERLTAALGGPGEPGSRPGGDPADGSGAEPQAAAPSQEPTHAPTITPARASMPAPASSVLARLAAWLRARLRRAAPNDGTLRPSSTLPHADP